VKNPCGASNAQRYCAKDGGRLAHIPDNETQTFLDETIAQDCENETIKDMCLNLFIGLAYKQNSYFWMNPNSDGSMIKGEHCGTTCVVPSLQKKKKGASNAYNDYHTWLICCKS